MTFYEKMILKDLKIPFAFGNAEDGWAPPFLVYRGSGAESFSADDTNYNTTLRRKMRKRSSASSAFFWTRATGSRSQKIIIFKKITCGLSITK